MSFERDSWLWCSIELKIKACSTSNKGKFICTKHFVPRFVIMESTAEFFQLFCFHAFSRKCCGTKVSQMGFFPYDFCYSRVQINYAVWCRNQGMSSAACLKHSQVYQSLSDWQLWNIARISILGFFKSTFDLEIEWKGYLNPFVVNADPASRHSMHCSLVVWMWPNQAWFSLQEE